MENEKVNKIHNKPHFNLLNRVGYEFVNNEGLKAKVIKYEGYLNSTVQFEDGVIVEKINFNRVKNNSLPHPHKYLNKELNKVYKSNEGFKMRVIGYHNSRNCDIQFNDKKQTIVTKVRISHVKDGNIKNPNNPFLCDIGYLGQGNYKTSLLYCSLWRGMISRCYSEKDLARRPSYKDVTVCESWYNYQVFAEWCEKNYVKSWELDKDILIKGNKIYSPETCCFVPKEINTFFIKRDAKRGKYPIGVTKGTYSFVSNMRLNNRTLHLGCFKTPEEAFEAYKIKKESCIKNLADKWKPLITPETHQAMYNYKVEITD